MSYIQETTSKEEFLESRTSPRTRSNVEYSLVQFDRFCISKFQRNSDNILKDLKEEHSVEKVYSILNAFVIWASKDHPEMVTFRGRYKTIPFPFKALNPITIRRYLNNIRAYFEEVGQNFMKRQSTRKEKSWKQIRKSTNGTMLIESPPRRPSGMIYKIYEMSKLKKNVDKESAMGQFKTHEKPATLAVDAGLINQEFLDAERERLGSMYPMYYECDFYNSATRDTRMNISSIQIMERICRD